MSCKKAMWALLFLGSASLLFSCDTKPATTVYDYETLLTESSENRTITMMENGKRSYTFVSPLMEGYSLASNPYQEFRRGINMTTYTDSLSLVDATITANYAIYYERQKLWEAKGNVVIIKRNRKGGDTVVTGLTEIYTQQLFWNATTKKIYSNVDTKVLQPDGWHFGVGFDADEDLKNIHFRKYSSEMEFEMSQPDPSERKTEESEDDKQSTGSKSAQNKSKSAETSLKPSKPSSTGVNSAQKSADRNVSPMPVGRPERPGSVEESAKPKAPVMPAAPSMGGKHPVGLQGGSQDAQQLNVTSAAGPSTLRGGAKTQGGLQPTAQRPPMPSKGKSTAAQGGADATTATQQSIESTRE